MESAEPASLVCREIRLRQFRNFAELELQFTDAGAAIIGDNGSGKTNLLEAVHYLEIFRSFRGAADENLVRFGAEAFHVRGRFEDRATGRRVEVTAAYEPRTRRKRVTIDGVEATRIGDAIGRLGTVIFSPSDVGIVAGAPGERRRFLDIVLSLNVHGYVDALQRYRQVLRQRNALLREGRGGAAITAWDEALLEYGATVAAARATWVAAYADRYSEVYSAVGGGADAGMVYQPDVMAEQLTARDSVMHAFRARLERVALRERERRVTLAGPHRDDLSLVMTTADGTVDLRQFGSGGQLRTGAVALRMVEAETVRAARGFRPLLLLDDVFAELDAGRSMRILELLAAGAHGQVILTAPKESDVLLDELGGNRLVAPLSRWRIAAARVFT
jgi:DNA replication and repair protein RecF